VGEAGEDKVVVGWVGEVVEVVVGWVGEAGEDMVVVG